MRTPAGADPGDNFVSAGISVPLPWFWNEARWGQRAAEHRARARSFEEQRRASLDRIVARTGGWRPVLVASGVASFVGMGLGLFLGSAVASPWPVLSGLFVAGAASASAFPAMFEKAGDLARQVGLAPDAGPGLVSGIARGGMLIGPVLVGQVADRAGLFVALGLVPLAGLVISVAAAALLRR